MKPLDDHILEAKVDDAIRCAQSGKAVRFIGFLDERQVMQVKSVLKNRMFKNYMFWGGFSEAERVVFGAFPDYLEPSAEEFPLLGITGVFRKQDVLRHRDFLGALLAQGLTRETIGDILVEEGRAVFFVRKEVSALLLNNIQKVGSVGISLQVGVQGSLPAAHHFREITGVVASSRLDCLVALFAGLSREKAAGLIRSGLVMVNHEIVQESSFSMQEGMGVSIRGTGRFVVDKLGPVTKKGRLNIAGRKYE